MNFRGKKHLQSEYCSPAPARSGCCVCSLEQGCKQQQMPVGGNQIKEYCKCCTERGGASQTGWRGIIPILKGCYQTFHSPAFLTVLLIKQVHLLFSVQFLSLSDFYMSLILLFSLHRTLSVVSWLWLICTPVQGQSFGNTGLFLPCILQNVAPDA